MLHLQHNASKLRRSFFEKNEVSLLESLERKTGNLRRLSTRDYDSHGRILTTLELHAALIIQRNYRAHRKWLRDLDQTEVVTWRKLVYELHTNNNKKDSSADHRGADTGEDLTEKELSVFDALPPETLPHNHHLRRRSSYPHNEALESSRSEGGGAAATRFL
jgi:hypothetical protein